MVLMNLHVEHKYAIVRDKMKAITAIIILDLRSLCINYYGVGVNSCNGDMSVASNCAQCVKDCLQRVCGCPAYG